MTTLAQDLEELRRLKDTAEEDGRDKKDADAAFKQHQQACLDRMEAEECGSFRHPKVGYLYSIVNKVKGQIEDRQPYIRWALENDPAIVEFLEAADVALGCHYEANHPARAGFADAFFEAIMSTSTVSYKEKGDVMNQQARAHVDDGAPLPPGLTFRPDPYISMTKS